MKQVKSRLAAIMFATAACIGGGTGFANADKLKHTVAVFAGLDKITGRIMSFEVAINETVQFGTLQITPRVCYSRPPTEAPQTDGFVQVYDVKPDHSYNKIFSGWMFADSPGLNGVEHPIYDVWLTGCKGTATLIRSPDVADVNEETQTPPAAVPVQSGTALPPSPLKRGIEPAPINRGIEPGGAASEGAAAPPLGPPVYVPSRPDPISGNGPAPARPAATGLPPGPRPPASIPYPRWRQPTPLYYPPPPDPDNPYQ